MSGCRIGKVTPKGNLVLLPPPPTRTAAEIVLGDWGRVTIELLDQSEEMTRAEKHYALIAAVEEVMRK